MNIKEKIKKIKTKHIILSIIPLLAFPGFVWFMLPSFLNSPVINESFVEYVNADTSSKTLDNITVKNGRIYKIESSITDVSGTVITAAKIERDDGTVIWNAGAGVHYRSNTSIFLNAGEYKVTFDFDSQEESDVPVDIQFKIL